MGNQGEDEKMAFKKEKKKRKEWTYKYATREHQPRVKVISEDYVLS